MKKQSVLFLVLAILFLSTSIHAQFKIGIRAGLSSQNISYSDLLIANSEQFQELKLQVESANLGVHFGIMTQINLGTFFIQPEVLFNSNRVDFKLTDFENQFADQIFSEEYQYVDIPVMLGARLGPFRIGAGPVGHVFVNSMSDLLKFDQYDQNFRDLTIGWQGGIGVDLWRLHFDLRYEGNLNNFGDHITWGGQDFDFADTPSRVLASIAISF